MCHQSLVDLFFLYSPNDTLFVIIVVMIEISNHPLVQQLQLMEQQAARLSQSLGVGKLPPTLRTPLVGFLKEGMRHAFSNETSEMEEPLMLGGRLTFLTLLSK